MKGRSLPLDFIFLCLNLLILFGESNARVHTFGKTVRLDSGRDRQSSKERTDWNEIARRELQRELRKEKNTNVAKNIILCIGDGMSPTTVTASRILKGQLQGRPGEEEELVFEQFPSIGISKTYGADQQTPDSAQTATAMLCGEKNNLRVLGLDDRALAGDCPSIVRARRLKCITRQANDEGKSVGFVTTSRVTHATPAAGYAYTPVREWEGDSEKKGEDPLNLCEDVAKQLILDNDYIQVIMGGGRQYFLPNTTDDPVFGKRFIDRHRQDGLDLTQIWRQNLRAKRRRAEYVWNKKDFFNVNPRYTDNLLGLFHSSHMSFSLDNDKVPEDEREPTLAEMTEKAIQMLSHNDRGYFLMIEGALIDQANHRNNAKRTLTDTLAFEEAVKQAIKMTSSHDTLILVTSDHGHSIHMGGYTTRGNDILGLADGFFQPNDGKPFTTLSFTTGLGHEFGNRTDLTNVDVGADEYLQAATVPALYSSHGGEDVTIYATGPMAHLFEGMHEQHYIAHAMMFASCLGPDKRHCRQRKRNMRKHRY